MKDFRQLQIWRRAHQFVLALYSATKAFPNDELYGLTSQIRRAAVSIPSNIAEGCGRGGDPELARFCRIAMGSASEVEYQLELAKDLSFLSVDTYEALCSDLVDQKKMLNSFITKLTANR
ncbi:MAG: four helix bundle protein [Verrucomicrobiales bacterium]|nr:four helix bundle protein [Verrucomicrobiales bacterium]